MSKYCLQCGAELRDEALFCFRCGAETRKKMQEDNKLNLDTGNMVPSEMADKSNMGTVMLPTRSFSSEVSHHCLQCGAELREGALFCPRCGTETRKKKQDEKISYFDMGKSVLSEMADKSNMAAIMSPARTFASILSRMRTGLGIIKKKPLSAMPGILLCIIWFILQSCRRQGIDNPITGFLSWLSYGGDVTDRSLFGVLGTAVGRGTVAVAFSFMFTGGGRNIRNGISRFFSKKEKEPVYGAAGWFITGAGASLIISRILEGTPEFSRVMAVISLVIVSLQALGNKKSWLYSVAISLTAKGRTDVARIADTGAARMIMTGSIVGFLFMTAYSAENSLISLTAGDTFLSALPTVAGVILLIVGTIMNTSARKQKQ